MARRLPIVGVPCFTTCDATLTRPRPPGAQRLDELRPDHDGGDHRRSGPRSERGPLGRWPGSRRRCLRARRRARPSRGRRRRGGGSRARPRPRRVRPRRDRRVVVARAASPTPITSTPRSAARRPIGAAVALRRGSELRHLAQDRDAAAVAGALGEVLERRLHRALPRVVRRSRRTRRQERELLASPGRKPDVGAPLPARSRGRPSAAYAWRAASAFSAWWRCVNGSSSSTTSRVGTEPAERRRARRPRRRTGGSRCPCVPGAARARGSERGRRLSRPGVPRSPRRSPRPRARRSRAARGARARCAGRPRSPVERSRRARRPGRGPSSPSR